jgi:hypothetical protein
VLSVVVLKMASSKTCVVWSISRSYLTILNCFISRATTADLLSLHLGGRVGALHLLDGGAPQEVLVRRSWVVRAAVPSLDDEARLQELHQRLVPVLGATAPDGLEQARLDGGRAS